MCVQCLRSVISVDYDCTVTFHFLAQKSHFHLFYLGTICMTYPIQEIHASCSNARIEYLLPPVLEE